MADSLFGSLMQRHLQDHANPSHEGHALLRHISMTEPQDNNNCHEIADLFLAQCHTQVRQQRACQVWLIFSVLLVGLVLTSRFVSKESAPVPIERAQEHMLDIGGGLSLWYRTWGNRRSGVPVLFVHGGPGNCIADYGNGNARFFDQNEFFVVEVDQRGTGKSQPSVRDDCRNMKFYRNITIAQMSHDYELVRESLEIDQWLVFGGSWGSTLSIDYVERYPEPCLGLILRGVWLNTRPEFDAIFTRRPYRANKEQLAKFDTWFEIAAQEVIDTGEPELDPNDGERFFRIYGRMIQQCNKQAMWRWHAWENNEMEEDPKNLLDPHRIDPSILPEAMSISFFENRLFLDGTFDNPSNLLDSVNKLQHIHVWICQGLQDKVCPTKYGALKLVDALVESDVTVRSQFLDAGHEDTNPKIAQCLEEAVNDFLEKLDGES